MPAFPRKPLCSAQTQGRKSFGKQHFRREQPSGSMAALTPALLPGQGGAGKGQQGAKCPEGAEEVLGSSLPCRSFSLHCWGHPVPLGTATGHHGRGTRTCRRLQLLQDGGDSQLLLLRGGTQVLVVQQLEQNAELWQELVQH